MHRLDPGHAIGYSSQIAQGQVGGYVIASREH